MWVTVSLSTPAYPFVVLMFIIIIVIAIATLPFRHSDPFRAEL